MFHLHKWKYPTHPTKSIRICLKCNRQEREVLKDTFSFGPITEWQLDNTEPTEK